MGGNPWMVLRNPSSWRTWVSALAASDVADGGSDHLVDAIVAWGDEAAIARRVTEHRDGGADHVLLQPLGDLGSALTQLERLAPALLGR